MSDFVSTFILYEKKFQYLDCVQSDFEDVFWNSNDAGWEEFYLKPYNETIKKIHSLIEKYPAEFLDNGISKENHPFRVTLLDY